MTSDKMKIIMKDQSAWTFIETLIVISIILILTGTVGFMAVGYVDKARIVAAKAQIENLSMALDSYFMDTMQYPSEEQGLEALWIKPILEPVPKNWDGPYVKKSISKDPWGTPYEYTVPGPNRLPYGIRSFGKDGNHKGQKIAPDITSWNN